MLGKIIYSKTLSAFPEIIHGSSTKSYGPLIFSKGLEPVAINNQRRFFYDLGIDPKKVILTAQAHTNHIAIVNKNDRGAGIFGNSNCLRNTDGLVTREKGIFLGIFSADCLPILFYDPQNKVVSAIHAGWKGTIKQIAKKAVDLLIKEFQSKPQNLIVWLGPSIGPCCYEVSEKKDARIAQFEKIFPRNQKITIRKRKKVYLDLWEANKKLLKNSGVKEKNIENSCFCTACHNDILPSNYKEGEARTTTIITIIGLRDD